MKDLVQQFKKGKKIFIGNDNARLIKGNIIYAEAFGEQTKKETEAIYAFMLEYLESVTRHVNIIIDINESGKNDPDARKVWKKITELEKVNKVALFGFHPVARVLASFVINITSSNNLRFFTSKEEALDWILKPGPL